eukprot:3047881-Rhodomonas_salina.2
MGTASGVLMWEYVAIPGGCTEDRSALQVSYATCLRACYAVSGTAIANGAICLRAHYAVSGTDTACGTVAWSRQYHTSKRR